MFPEVTDAVERVLRMPSDVSKTSISLLERFVVRIYDRNTKMMEVNDARKQLFAQNSQDLSNTTPNACCSPSASQACLSSGKMLESDYVPKS